MMMMNVVHSIQFETHKITKNLLFFYLISLCVFINTHIKNYRIHYYFFLLLYSVY